MIVRLERMIAEGDAKGLRPGRLAITDDAAWELAVELATVDRNIGSAEKIYLELRAGTGKFQGIPVTVAN